MDLEIKISEPIEMRDRIITYFKKRNIIPIVGTGLSCGSEAYNGKVPTGVDYKNHMIKELSRNEDFSEEERIHFKHENFSTLCDYYEDDENVPPTRRLQYLKDNFYKAHMEQSDIRSLFFKVGWPYIYSLNLDDTIENSSSYKRIILPNRSFNEEIFNEEKCLIKLHGDIGEIIAYKKYDKIFTSKEYALSIDKNAPLLNKLRHDYQYNNILFIGCSLDDEADLKTLAEWPFDCKEKDGLTKTIVFLKGKPGKTQKSKFKVYGVTDVVCFEDYEQMYRFLYEAWLESQKISKDELDSYNTIPMVQISSADREENQKFFLWGKRLYDSKERLMKYPYFFISRKITTEIMDNIKENKVHLVYGTRISGKSYLLADLYRKIRDRQVYYFDGRSRLSQKALHELLDRKNIVALFDIGTLSREQFELVLQEAQTINRNKSNFILNVNLNDSDAMGIVKWKLRQNIIKSGDILSYRIDNKFKDYSDIKEINTINKLLPFVNLPPYNERQTILDQIIYTEKSLSKKGKFSSQHININGMKQVALLIILAIKEKLYSSDIINFAFDQEIIYAIKQYSPFIEREEVYDFEKDTADLSNVKYILNSRYWLRRELGNFARAEGNYRIIGEAYQYIVRKAIEFSGHDEYKQRKVCRNYILFDVMNDIFLDEYQGNLKLIVYVYTKLHEYLAKDYHFLHQNAKCYVNYAYFLKNPVEKEKYLNEARELASIAKTMIEYRFEETQNERLLISIAHAQYTIATIWSEICKLHQYMVVEELQKAIDSISEAIYSPFNSDDYQRERKKGTSAGIFSFVTYAASNINKIQISNEYQKKLSDLLNAALFGMK